MSEQVQIFEWRDASDPQGEIAQLDTAMGRGEAHQILDLKRLMLINSAGLGFLLRVRRRLDERGGELVLSEASPQVARALATLGLDELFRIFDRESDAVTYFQAQAGPAGAVAIRVARNTDVSGQAD